MLLIWSKSMFIYNFKNWQSDSLWVSIPPKAVFGLNSKQSPTERNLLLASKSSPYSSMESIRIRSNTAIWIMNEGRKPLSQRWWIKEWQEWKLLTGYLTLWWMTAGYWKTSRWTVLKKLWSWSKRCTEARKRQAGWARRGRMNIKR